MFEKETLQERHSSCCDRANQLAWKIIKDITDLGMDVVIEGWGSRKLRNQVRKKAKELDIEVAFYFVTCPREERLQRIRRRNGQVNADAPYISEEDFHRMEENDEDFEADETFTIIENSKPNIGRFAAP